MLKLIAAPALVLATLASPAMAQSQEFTTIIAAPANMDEDQLRQWDRLDRQSRRLTERVANGEVKVMDEQSDVARAQARIAEAQAKLREEQRELERAVSRLAEHREELAATQGRMLDMGGSRSTVALNGQ
ncbi:hypothetical protein [Alteraurantiacibacter aquimixticola]|uniref:Uncharacterized protein n=1 Tax=Alteraurantiacibacter aquimixticola TaxID=2489173 RepID=A0A4T3EZF1_9SPHN|nr:hypothetical protein [Alteraurantiacibacter aquimixticola]TIX49259.1 hypothetical protein E5222_16275 [Alteraurantiacibacter aquimixticola]